MTTLPTTTTILTRFFIRWKITWYNFILLRILEPAIFLYAIGFGLALAYNTVGGVPYLNYVIPGIMTSTVMYGALIDGAYGTLTRVIYQGLWKSQLATTITLRQIILTENLFTGFKAAISCFFILVAGLIMNGVDFPLHIFPAFMVLFLGGITLSSLAQAIASFANAYEDLECVWALVISPMFLFSGIFIPINSFPEALQTLVKTMPVYHIVEPVRALMLNTATLTGILPHLAALAAFFIVTHLIAHHRYKNRLFA